MISVSVGLVFPIVAVKVTLPLASLTLLLLAVKPTVVFSLSNNSIVRDFWLSFSLALEETLEASSTIVSLFSATESWISVTTNEVPELPDAIVRLVALKLKSVPFTAVLEEAESTVKVIFWVAVRALSYSTMYQKLLLSYSLYIYPISLTPFLVLILFGYQEAFETFK